MNIEDSALLEEILEDEDFTFDTNNNVQTGVITDITPINLTREYLAKTEIQINLFRIVEFGISYVLEYGKYVEQKLQEEKDNIQNNQKPDDQANLNILSNYLNLLKENYDKNWRIADLITIFNPVESKVLNKFFEDVITPTGFITESNQKDILIRLIEQEFKKLEFYNNKQKHKYSTKNNLNENIFTKNNFNKFSLPYEDFILKNYSYNTPEDLSYNGKLFTGFVLLDYDNLKTLYEITLIEEIILNNNTTLMATASKIPSGDTFEQVKFSLKTPYLCSIYKYFNDKLLSPNIYNVSVLNDIIFYYLHKYLGLLVNTGDYKKIDIVLQEINKIFNNQIEEDWVKIPNPNLETLEQGLLNLKNRYLNTKELMLFKPFIILKGGYLVFVNDFDLTENQSIKELIDRISFTKYDFVNPNYGRQLTVNHIGFENHERLLIDKSNIKSDLTILSMDTNKKYLEELSFGKIESHLTRSNNLSSVSIEKTVTDPYTKFALLYLSNAKDSSCAEPGKLDINKNYVELKIKNIIETFSLNFKTFKENVQQLPKGRYSINNLEENLLTSTLPKEKLVIEFIYSLLKNVIEETKSDSYPREFLSLLDKEYGYSIDEVDYKTYSTLQREHYFSKKQPKALKDIGDTMYYFLLANTYLNLFFPELGTSNILYSIPIEHQFKEITDLKRCNLKEVLEERVKKLTESEHFNYNSLLIPEINFLKDVVNPRSRSMSEYKIILFSYYVTRVMNLVSDLLKDFKEQEEVIEYKTENNDNIDLQITLGESPMETSLASILEEMFSEYITQSEIKFKGTLNLDLKEIKELFLPTVNLKIYSQDYISNIDKKLLLDLKEASSIIQLQSYGIDIMEDNNNQYYDKLFSKEDWKDSIILLSDNNDFNTRLGLSLEKNKFYIKFTEQLVDLNKIWEEKSLTEKIKDEFRELVMIDETSITKSDLINITILSKSYNEEKWVEQVVKMYAKLLYLVYETLTKDSTIQLINRIIQSKNKDEILKEDTIKIVNRKVNEILVTRFNTATKSTLDLDRIIIDTISILFPNQSLTNYILNEVKMKDVKSNLSELSELDKTYNLFLNRIQFLPITALTYLNKLKMLEKKEKDLAEQEKLKKLDFPNKTVVENMVNSLYEVYLQTGLQQPIDRIKSIKIPDSNLDGYDLISPLLLTQETKLTYRKAGEYSVETLYKTYTDDLLTLSQKMEEGYRMLISDTYDFGVSVEEAINDNNRGSDSINNKIRNLDLLQFILDIEKCIDADFVNKLPESLKQYLEKMTYVYLKTSKHSDMPYTDTKLNIRIVVKEGRDILNADSNDGESATL